MDVVNETKSLLLSMGAAPIMWFMLLLSLVSITVMLERALFFRSIAEDVEVIARRLSALLSATDYDGAQALMRSCNPVFYEIAYSIYQVDGKESFLSDVARMFGFDGVAAVEINGGQTREIQVNLDPRRLEALAMPITEVASKLAAENLDYLMSVLTNLLSGR